jgi:hypothetical protein
MPIGSARQVVAVHSADANDVRRLGADVRISGVNVGGRVNLLHGAGLDGGPLRSVTRPSSSILWTRAAWPAKPVAANDSFLRPRRGGADPKLKYRCLKSRHPRKSSDLALWNLARVGQRPDSGLARLSSRQLAATGFSPTDMAFAADADQSNRQVGVPTAPAKVQHSLAPTPQSPLGEVCVVANLSPGMDASLPPWASDAKTQSTSRWNHRRRFGRTLPAS